MYYKKCEICGIHSGRKYKQQRVFLAKFPLDEMRCKQWVKAIGIEDLAYLPIEKLHQLKYVCGTHFKPKDFNTKRTRLKRCAIPSLHLKREPLAEELIQDFPLNVAKSQESTEPKDKSSTAIKANASLLDDLPSASTDRLTVKHVNLVANIEKEHDYCSNPKKSNQKRKRAGSTFTDSEVTPREKKLCETGNWPSASMYSRNLVENIEKEHDYCSNPKKSNQKQKRTIPTLTDSEVTPREKKLARKIHNYKEKIKSMRKGNIMKNIKSVALKSLIQAFIRNRGRKSQGKRYSPTDKAIALAIYKKSPRTYRLLKQILSLPSARTLQTILQKMDLEPGINQTTVEFLKKKAVKLNDKEKIGVLLFDEVALKKRLIYNARTEKVEGYVDLGDGTRNPEIADHALVFMLQGVYKKLKQPVAYYFVKGTMSSQNLAELIKKVIAAITNVGYEIIATVCDQGPTNIGGLNLLKSFSCVKQECNYFLINGKKVFILFDIPHLFKSIRNNFYQGGEIVVDGKKGKWCHLIELEEKNKSTLHFKKITAIHVNPKYRSKMKVKFASQILSNTVSAILKLLAEKYKDDVKGREILETAMVIESLDRLFDCTNGPSSRHDIKRKIRENVSKDSNHLHLWKEYKQKIKTMHFLKSDSSLRLRNVRCVQGYYTSLCSLEDVWRHVDSKGFKYLNLRQLNQDSLENLFGMIRQHCPTNRNPTCHHFTAALKSIILTRLSTPVSRGANCEEDNNEAMIDFEDFFHPVETVEDINMTELPMIYPDKSAKKFDSSPSQMFAHIGNDVANTLEIPTLHITENADSEDLKLESHLFETFEKQPIVYVAGYLASVIFKKNKWPCDSCKQCFEVTDPDIISNPMYGYIRLREWWTDKKSLTYPTLNLCNLVHIVTKNFEQIKHRLYEKNIANYIISVMLTKFDSLPWICKNHKIELLHAFLYRLSCLLIRSECHKINLSFATAEEKTADFIKKAQQQGTAK